MQKEIILDSLCSMANHPTAENVYDFVHGKYPSISRATVYRVLNQLAEKGTILKISISNGADRFDHLAFPHYHMRCSCCGRVFDMPPLELNIPQTYFSSCAQYSITGYTLQFSGICPECHHKGGT